MAIFYQSGHPKQHVNNAVQVTEHGSIPSIEMVPGYPAYCFALHLQSSTQQETVYSLENCEELFKVFEHYGDPTGAGIPQAHSVCAVVTPTNPNVIPVVRFIPSGSAGTKEGWFYTTLDHVPEKNSYPNNN